MWIIDHLWYCIAVFIAVGIGAFLVWNQNSRREAFALMLISVAGVLGLGLLDYLVVTPQEEVQQSVKGVVAACAKNSLEETLGFIDPAALQIRDVVTQGMNLVEIQQGLRLSDLQVTMEPDRKRAMSHFRANGTISAHGISSHVATRWNLTWQRTETGWKIISIERLDPINGKSIGVYLINVQTDVTVSVGPLWNGFRISTRSLPVSIAYRNEYQNR